MASGAFAFEHAPMESAAPHKTTTADTRADFENVKRVILFFFLLIHGQHALRDEKAAENIDRT